MGIATCLTSFFRRGSPSVGSNSMRSSTAINVLFAISARVRNACVRIARRSVEITGRTQATIYFVRARKLSWLLRQKDNHTLTSIAAFDSGAVHTGYERNVRQRFGDFSIWYVCCACGLGYLGRVVAVNNNAITPRRRSDYPVRAVFPGRSISRCPIHL